MENNGGSGGRGGRGGRGRGGRRGRGSKPHYHDTRGTAVTEADAPAVSKEPDWEEDIRVHLPGAFAVSFPDINRVKERGRAFVVPVAGSDVGPNGERPQNAVAAGGKRVFLVAERTIAGLDDIVYEKHRAVWENLPRGNARVFIFNESRNDCQEKTDQENALLALSGNEDAKKTQQPVLTIEQRDLTRVAAINGLRKFSYNDKPQESAKGNYGYDDEVDAVVALEKENGECGHISALVLGSGEHRERFWVTGSKNVHIVVPYFFTEEMIKSTYKAKRYGYAAKIALQWKEVMDLAATQTQNDTQQQAGVSVEPGKPTVGVDRETFKDVTPEGLLRFHDLLAENNCTACFEAIFRDSQHLVDYKNRNEFRFFAMTENATYENQLQPDSPNSALYGLCVDIQQSFKQFADCGLPTAPLYYGRQEVDNHHFAQLHKVPYKSAAYEALVDDIGHRQNSEGCVMYGYKTASVPLGKCRVMKVWKEKAYPYVMERATREAIVNHKLAGKGLAAKITKKLALQKPHIRKYFAEWEETRLPFLMLFSAYLQVSGKLNPYMTKEDSFTTIRNHWLSLQREFSEKLESDGELRTVCERFVPGESTAENEEGDGSSAGMPSRASLRLDVIKFVGAQGCGKSTMSRILFFLLAEANFKPRWLNQDEAGNRNNYLAAIKKAAQEAHTVNEPADASANKNKITHLLLDKMNLDKRTNADYNRLPEPAVTVCFTYENENGEEASGQESARKQHSLIQLLLSRVVHRGSGHRTIKIPEGISTVERKNEENKVRKFLSQAVRSCELPEDDDNVILVDVTDSLERQIAQIWSALQENGFYEVPNLDTLHLDLAIDVAARYERFLTSQARAPLYASLSVLPTEHEKLLAVIDPAALSGKKVQNEFHVTTKYFVGDPDPLFLVALAELAGSSYDVTLEAVAADAKGVAIRVKNANPLHHNEEGTGARYANDIIAHFLAKAGVPGVVPRCAFPCANDISHITIANAPGVPPVYSNELLAKDPGSVIPGHVTVKATFVFR